MMWRQVAYARTGHAVHSSHVAPLLTPVSAAAQQNPSITKRTLLGHGLLGRLAGGDAPMEECGSEGRFDRSIDCDAAAVTWGTVAPGFA